MLTNKTDSLITKKKDTIVADSIKKPKEVIDGIITHNAEDYTIQNAKNKTVTLFNKAHVTYQDINLKAGKIIVDYKNNTVYATGFKDSTGYVQRPVFKQGSQESEQDSILFNFKTEKALIYGVKTMQGEMITYGEQTKRVNDSTIYMRKLRFTTSKKENPDYYIATNKAKLVPGKKIIVGGSNLVLADVPTPVYLPFAYFPLSQSRTSGFIIPSWGENNQQGFFLQNGGYYFAINDYFDLQVTGDLYSNGSWAINTESNYSVRYKFSGGLRFRYQNLITGIRGFSDYSKTSKYNITWSHNQDSKSSPNSRLSASVNLGSSKFYKESLNEIDQSQYLTNTFNSSISYYKKFVGTPFNMNVTMTHSQNSNTEVIKMTLPSLQLNMDRIYPFAGKGGVKKNALQKVGLNYSMQGQYLINTTDEEFFTSKMFEEAKTGIQHNASANTNIKAFKFFTLSPNMSYKDVWYFNKINKHYDPNILNSNGNLGAAVNDTISGFTRFNEYNVGVSLSTNIYGTFNFKKGRLKALRHTVRPSISWSYRPDFATQHQLEVQQSADPNNILTYTPFESGIYGQPGSGISNSIGISLNNVLEAKVKPKDEDSDEEDKKVMILNNLNFSTSYNIAADSLRWSKVSYSASTRLFKDKMAVNLSGSLDPYQVTSEGVQIDKFNPSIFRIQQATLTANYSVSSKDFDNKEDDNESKSGNGAENNPPDVLGTDINPTNGFPNQRASANKKDTEKTAKLYHANIPWNVSFVYSSSYTNNGYSIAGIQSHTLGFSGNVELTPKWKVGFASGYDIQSGAFSYTRLNFSRDLDSWRFNFNWIPFGTRTSYNFFIGVKSSMLSDLKWDKNKPPDRTLF
ncbi:putative LPS assembly protein LptD [Tenacibaculum adriaticum]|uniref:putative LPS assembly protein LptD n=1 Tax=Tenacibaculum adriaticum TaxID=413713 RepID=UPI001FE8F2A5|nr:putative LPS assembly protein LptD [Tenacibaculum adriaticum]